ncbi:MAG TPA: substrate-binding domain-containing protein [Faecalibacter sp.]
MVKNKLLLIGCLLALACTPFSCSKKEEVKAEESKTKGIEKPLHTYGKLKVTADPSYENVLKALTSIYTLEYPEVEFEFDYKIEELAIKDLYEGKTNFAVVSKPLTKEQETYLFNKTKILFKSSPIGMDATVFITSVNNPLDSIHLNEIKENVYNENGTMRMVFDYPNSANFNTLNDKLGITPPKGQSINALKSAENVIDFVQKDQHAIGIIGLNTLSDTDNPKVQEYLKKVKILKVVDAKGNVYAPTNPNLRNGLYPFYRLIYFLKNEKGFGIAAGFTRFTGSQQGQLIILKENLQPYYLYKREVQLNSQSLQPQEIKAK